MKRLLTIILVILLLPSASLGDSFADMLEKAENYKTGIDYEKAIASFLFSQKLNSKHEEAFLGEANIRILIEDYEGAFNTVEKALEINPVSAEAWKTKCRWKGYSALSSLSSGFVLRLYNHALKAFRKMPIVFFRTFRRSLQVMLTAAPGFLCQMAFHQQSVNFVIRIPFPALVNEPFHLRLRDFQEFQYVNHEDEPVRNGFKCQRTNGRNNADRIAHLFVYFMPPSTYGWHILPLFSILPTLSPWPGCPVCSRQADLSGPAPARPVP